MDRMQQDPRRPRLEAVSSTARLIVVDDHLAFAEALAERLRWEPDFAVAAVVTSGEGARREVTARKVDVALVDLGLPDIDGVTLSRDLREMCPGLRVVIISAGGRPDQVADAIRSGVSAWVPKDCSIDYLIDVLRGVLRGESRFPGRLLTDALAVLLSAEHERTEAQEVLSRLTAREVEVLTCMAEGLSRAQIAERLYLSPNTVRTHMQSILGKLGVHSSLAAVALGRKLEIC